MFVVFLDDNCDTLILINNAGGVALYQIDDFIEMNRLEKIAITKHAKERMEERGIKVDDIIYCIDTGEIIKQY